MSKEKLQKKRIIVKKKQRNRKRIYFMLGIALLAMIVLGAYGGYLYIEAKNAIEDSYVEDTREEGKSELRVEEVDPDFDNVSVLIMGIDESEKRGNAAYSLTDALMLATLNKEDKS